MDEEKLLKLDLQKENQKNERNQIKGPKLTFFKLVYLLLRINNENNFREIILIIFQFMQLMAFSMDKVFSSGWKTYWYGTIGNFFRYCQLVNIWTGNSQFYIITYMATCVYILLLSILLIHSLIKIKTNSFNSKNVLNIILKLIEFEPILNIPFYETLLSVFSCQNKKLEIASDIECEGGIQGLLIIISIIFSIIFLFIIILFKMTLFDFATIHGKFKASYTSETEVSLIIMKVILVIIYQFIKHEMALALISFCISLFLFFDFLGKQPFVQEFLNKLYFTLYSLFLWSNFTCVIALLLKNSKFEGGVILLLLGYVFIVLSTMTKIFEFSIEKIFEISGDNDKDGYKTLIEIQHFLKLEDSLEDRIRTKESKLLYSYINNYEQNCVEVNCPLKTFLKIPLKIENFLEMKVCLVQHAEMLYKNATSKHPFNPKIRLSYGLFLYNRLNKKQKGINEILLLNKYNTNLEDSFLIYKAQRTIEEENEGFMCINVQKSQLNNPIIYRTIFNNIKKIIGKITTNYVDFWTILAESGENKGENFKKLSKIGNKITKLSEQLSIDSDRLQKLNLYDQDTLKIYTQYLSEVLNDYPLANSFNHKLMELEQNKHQYNEENLFELNYQKMAKSEEYKYIVINCSIDDFGKIINLSLNACPIFGYYKEELIGKNIDLLIPDIFNTQHKNILLNKVNEFKKSFLIKNKNTKVHSEAKIIESFAKTKMNYLVPIKLKISIISTEEDKIFSIAKIIIENRSIVNIEQEISYVLTDKDFIIRNFNPSAPKLLSMQSSTINNDLDITEYIKGFIEDCHQYIEDNELNKKMLKQVKIDLIHKLYCNNQKKKIYWKLGDIVQNEFLKNKDVSTTTLFGKKYSLAKKNSIDPKSQSAFGDVALRPKMKTKFKSQLLKKLSNKYNSTLDEKDKNFEKINDNKEKEDSDISIDANGEGIVNGGDKHIKNYFLPIRHKFFLSAEEIKINHIKVGYLFKFELFKAQNSNESNNNISNQKTDITLPQSNIKSDSSDIYRSDISIMSFANKQLLSEPKQIIFNANSDNPNGVNLGLDDTFIPKISKENQFTIDLEKTSYKQFNLDENLLNNDPYEILKQEAMEKIAKVAKNMKKKNSSEEEEEEEESYEESGEDSEEHENSSNEYEKENNDQKQSKKDVSFLSQDVNKISVTNNSNESKISNDVIQNKSQKNTLLQNNNNLNNNIIKKKEEDDYYHIDVNKIALYIYNYNTGFVELIKDSKYKLCQVVKQINKEKEQLNKMNTKFIANPKLAKEKKKGGMNKKLETDVDELDSYSEKQIKLKEIQKALNSKEKQSSIINLCIFSFIVFAIIIGTSIASIMINKLLKKKFSTHYNLMGKSLLLEMNIIYESNYLREMLFIPNKKFYTNRFNYNDSEYYKIYADICYDYYLDSSDILSYLSSSINTLNTELKNQLTGPKIKVYILKKIDQKYYSRDYEINIYSAFHELNHALYHISQIKLENMITFEDSVYYFLKNGLNNILMNAKNQVLVLTRIFLKEAKNEIKIIIICIVIVIICYGLCFFIFAYFYQKVEERKQNYLAVFYEIETKFIITSLTKCEKFSRKIQTQENSEIYNLGEKLSIKSSTIEDTEIDDEIGYNNIMKPNKNIKINITKNEQNTKTKNNLKTKIYGFIVIFILLAVQIFTYYYYYGRVKLYDGLIRYYYYQMNAMIYCILPYLGVREYIYDQKKTFSGQIVDEYLKEVSEVFYSENGNYTIYRNKYANYLSQNYNKKRKELFGKGLCELMESFMKKYPDVLKNKTTCEYFFYNTSSYGFYSVLTTFFEDIRALKNFIDKKIIIANQNNFTYNESNFNTEQYNEYYQKNCNDGLNSKRCKLYNETNPANALKTDIHKRLLIVFQYVIREIVIKIIDILDSTVIEAFDQTGVISLIINIIFICVVFIGFFFIWLPFVYDEDETIYKTKNMLSIIPKEILVSLPHINSMIGIEERKN